jgi:hypothetical protein
MNNSTEPTAKQDVIIQNVTNDYIQVTANGEVQQIKNGLEELKTLLQKLNAADFKSGDKIYNINSITNATFSAEIGKKTFNMQLCRKLTLAIQDYNPDAKEFLKKIKKGDEDNWETQRKYTTVANGYIISSFVGVLSILLRKLFASGKDASSTNNYKDYLEVCVATAKTTLQLISFAFLSRYWEYVRKKNFTLTSDQRNTLDNFFNTNVEMNITDYKDLFITLVTIFDEQQLEYPFSEIKNIGDSLKPGSRFMKTCQNLQEINNKLDSGQFSLSTAFEAENELTEFLLTLHFLANYKMVSVNDIVYEAVPSSEVQYLHSYTFLGADKENSVFYKYDSSPINTDAVFLYKNKYQDGLSLFPFIIDVNALTDELDVKICLFGYCEENKKRIIYTDINIISGDKKEEAGDFRDPSVVIISYNEDVERDMSSNEKDITRLKKDHQRYNDMKLNMAYKVFQNAKKAILE